MMGKIYDTAGDVWLMAPNTCSLQTQQVRCTRYLQTAFKIKQGLM